MTKLRVQNFQLMQAIQGHNYRLACQNGSKFRTGAHETRTNKVTERHYIIRIYNGSKLSEFVITQLLQCINRKVNCKSEKASVTLSAMSCRVRRMLEQAV